MLSTDFSFSEDEFLFFRLAQATLSMSRLVPKGHTVITVVIEAEKDDDVLNISDDEPFNLYLDSMPEVVPDISKLCVGHNMLKTSISQQVFLREYKKARKDFGSSIKISNLSSVGRNSEFAQIFTKDVYLRACKMLAEPLRIPIICEFC